MRRESVLAAHVGANANNGSQAGAAALNVNNSASNANVNISAALTHLTHPPTIHGGLSLTPRSNIRRRTWAPSTAAASGADRRRTQDEPVRAT